MVSLEWVNYINITRTDITIFRHYYVIQPTFCTSPFVHLCKFVCFILTVNLPHITQFTEVYHYFAQHFLKHHLYVSGTLSFVLRQQLKSSQICMLSGLIVNCIIHLDTFKTQDQKVITLSFHWSKVSSYGDKRIVLTFLGS